jgi:type I restriction enzyme R subunit
MEMAVFFSPSPDDYRRFATFNDTPGRVYCETVEIRPHHERLCNEDLVARFCTANDPLRMIFTCDPWMASLATPALATLYLDRPLQGPTLLAALTSVNRPQDEAKICGLVVDYIGHWPLLSTLQQRYRRAAERLLPQSRTLRRQDQPELPGAGAGAIQEKRQLVQELEQALKETLDFCARHGVEVSTLLAASERAQLEGLARRAADCLLQGYGLHRTFFARVERLEALYAALLPDEAAPRFVRVIEALGLTARIIRRALDCRSLDELLERPRGLVAEENMGIRYGSRNSLDAADGKPSLTGLELHRLSFPRLATLLKKSRTPVLKAEQLRSLLVRNLQLMSGHQPGAADALRHLEELRSRYESGQAPWQEYPTELLLFVRSLLESSASGPGTPGERTAGSRPGQHLGQTQLQSQAESNQPPDQSATTRL